MRKDCFLSKAGWVAVFSVFMFAGCGYRVAGKADGAAAFAFKTLSIPIFENHTHRGDIESVITSSVVAEFVNVTEVAGRGADAVMEGKINRYELRPVSYSKNDIISEYRLYVGFSVRLVRTSDSTVVWADPDITDYEDFMVDTASVSATKGNESKALEKIARRSARLIKERILSGF